MALLIHMQFDDMDRDQMRGAIKSAAKYQSRRQMPYHKRKEAYAEDQDEVDDPSELEEEAEEQERDMEERSNLVEEKRGSCPSCKVTAEDLPGIKSKDDTRRDMKVAKVKSPRGKKRK